MMNTLLQIKQNQSITTAHLIKNRTPAITCSNSRLNEFFEGGLYAGELIECGIPWGLESREVILSFIASAHNRSNLRPLWCLWVDNKHEMEIYPPGWEARGINLSYIRFAKCDDPIHEVKAVFLEDFFKLIVLDGFQNIKNEEYQFLAHMARNHNQIIILLTNDKLGIEKGNVWAKRRLNIRFDSVKNQYQLESVKGFSQKNMVFTMKVIPI